MFLAIRFIEGIAHICALSMLLTLASHALPDEQRGRAMGMVGGSMMLGIALGAPLGGFLGRSGVLLPLQLGGVLGLVTAGLAFWVVRESSAQSERPNLGDIARALRAHPSLLIPLAFALADRFTVGFFTTTFSLYLRRIYDLNSAEIGMCIAIFMIPFALLSYPFGRLAERFSLTLLICGGSIMYGLATAAVGFTAPPALYILMFATGVTASVMFVPSMVMVTRLAPPDIRATALGAFNAAGSLGFILGPLCGGAVSQAVAAQSNWLDGYRAAFMVAGFSELLCVAIALPFLLRLRASGRET
ncbi:MAG: MFS transporter [Deltaproteobacteria bacterium]|nr:MFS transporter [Deltaproteobacteria bacterium]